MIDAPQGTGAGPTSTMAAPQRVVLAAAVLALPLAINLALIATYGVNTPVFDQWWTGLQFAQFSDPALGAPDPFRQANESRPAVPLAVFYVLATLTNWNSKAEMLFTQALLCATVLCLMVTAQRALQLPPRATLVAGGLAALVLMSPVQDQSFLWGIQAITYVPAACLAGCMVVASGRRSFVTKLVACAALSWIAAYSYANGMIVWGLAPLLLVEDWRGQGTRARVTAIGVWALAALATVGTYFTDFQRPGGHPDLPGAADATRVLHAFLLYLGSPLASGTSRVRLATGAGAVLCVVVGALAWRWLRSDRPTRARATPLFVFGLYGLGSGAITVLGRLGFGVEYLLASRYVAFSTAVYASVFFLTAAWFPRAGARWRRLAVGAAICGVLAAHARAAYDTLPLYRAQKTERLQAKAATWLLPLVPYASVGSKFTLYLPEALALPAVSAVNRRGWLPSGLLHAVRHAASGAAVIAGQMQAQRDANGGVLTTVAGVCVLASRRPCDAVLLTEGFPSARACAIAFPSSEVAGVPVDGLSDPRIAWHAEVPDCGGSAAITAWAVDAEALTMTSLGSPGSG